MKYYFNKFIEYLVDNNIEITPYCFLILEEIKRIIESGQIETGRCKMSDKLKPYFMEFDSSQFNEESVDLNLDGLKFEDVISSGNEYPIERIDTVQIKNFRGFGEFGEEDKGCSFDFSDKNKIILYGPNGTGKSCFTEALEYTLTGDIKERIRKGKDLNTYVMYEKRKEPEISINNQEINLSLSENERLKKCFIEKNRITEFSIFRSKDTGVDDYRKVLTILLGLGELDRFILSFQKDTFCLSNKQKIEEIERNIETAEKDINGKKAVLLANKSKLENLKTGLIELGLLDKNSLKKNETIINSLKLEIENYDKKLEFPKMLENLEKLNKEEINSLEKDLESKEEELIQAKKELDEKKMDINMKNLYEAIRTLPTENRDICPACHTNSENRKENPFDNADKELKNMEKIIELEKKYESIKILVEKELPSKIKEKYIILNSNIGKLQRFDENINKDNYFEKLEYMEKDVNGEKIKEIIVNKEKKQKELHNMEYNLQQYDELSEEIGKLEPIINQGINNQIKDLLTKEKDKDAFLKKINENYGIFRNEMDHFYDNYLKHETESLRDDVCLYYKKINKHDDESEQVERISIKEENNKFEIMLHLPNGKEEDAINYLSEGHLKSLGLAILWADMKKNNVPFMIFDDVVNAIDMEHRSNIIEILHTDEFLSSKQLILTVHDRLFWEKYCNTFGPNDNSWISIILKHNNIYGINYEIYNTINYEEKIKYSIEQYDLRQAIIFMRILLETEIYAYLLNKDCDVKCKFEGSNIVKVKINSILGIFRDKIGKSKNFNEIEDDYNFVMKGLKRIILNQESHAHSKITYNIVESSTNKDVSELFRALKNLINFIHNNN